MRDPFSESVRPCPSAAIRRGLPDPGRVCTPLVTPSVDPCVTTPGISTSASWLPHMPRNGLWRGSRRHPVTASGSTPPGPDVQTPTPTILLSPLGDFPGSNEAGRGVSMAPTDPTDLNRSQTAQTSLRRCLKNANHHQANRE